METGALEQELDWAVQEFGDAQLGDARRTARLVELARALGAQPEASLPQALDAAALKAAYRFFDNDGVEHEAMLAAHVRSTYARARELPVILAAQDTTYVDYAAHPHTQGLGPTNEAGGHGLLVHQSVAFSPEGLPLGVLSQQIWARDPGQRGQRHTRRARPIEDKESHKWLRGLEAAAALKASGFEGHVVSVGDREADIYEVFLAAQAQGVQLLVRAAWDRRLSGPQAHLWAALAAAPMLGHTQVDVPRNPTRAARSAEVELRAAAVTLIAPRSRRELGPVSIHALWAIERDAPPGIEPLEWMLLSSLPIDSEARALQTLQWYRCRWQIEVFHRVLKSGCRIEQRQLESIERLQRLLALYAVIAWRVLYATMLARAVPQMPATVLLKTEEWEALYCRIHFTPIPCATAPPLRQAVRWIATLGGFIGRASDSEPGATTLWRGFQHLIHITDMYQIMKPHPPPPPSKRRKNVGKG